MENNQAIIQTPEQNNITKLLQYDEVVLANIVFFPPEERTIPAPPPIPGQAPSAPMKYYEIPIQYNFGIPISPRLNEFSFEGPEVYSPTGIISKTGLSGKMEYSILIDLDKNNVNIMKFVTLMNDIFKCAAEGLDVHKAPVRMFNFNKTQPEATGLKHPLYFPRVKATGALIEGRNPSIYLKLLKKGSGYFEEKTLFTQPGSKDGIAWPVLQGVEVSFIPYINFKTIYCGGKGASIQIKLLSAVITKPPQKRSTSNRQAATSDSLAKEKPDLVQSISDRIASLTMERQDLIDKEKNKQSQNKVSDSSNTPTFAGIGNAINTVNTSQGQSQQMNPYQGQSQVQQMNPYQGQSQGQQVNQYQQSTQGQPQPQYQGQQMNPYQGQMYQDPNIMLMQQKIQGGTPSIPPLNSFKSQADMMSNFIGTVPMNGGINGQLQQFS
jgi:hypothetical protein